MKPLLIFDGDCQFCRRWILGWQKITQDKVDYAPYQEVKSQYPQISDANFQKSVQLIDSDGSIYDGAEAVFRTLAISKNTRPLFWCYQHIPFFKLFSEFLYRQVAQNRKFISKFLTPKETCGFCPPQQATHAAVRWIFLRALGFIYLFAFLSLWVQIGALLGRDGILPAGEFLNAVASKLGLERFFLLPTLCWINASDIFLNYLCGLGALFSILLIIGIWPAPILFLLWLFYLSIANIGREFLSFQWDILLLETGFIAIFFAPFKKYDRLRESDEPSKFVLWLFRFLLFRLMFFSGFAKLASGDAAWRDLTALLFHYETQPLPTWIAWYANALPVGFQKLSVCVMFAIELIVPFFIFMSRKIRLTGYSLFIFLQIAIILTGNYCFFNLLTIALCLLLLDDQVFPELAQKITSVKPPLLPDWYKKVVVFVCSVLLAVAVTDSLNRVFHRPRWLAPIRLLSEFISPFRLVNDYGLFAVMTTKRSEIVMEGSQDGNTWLEYEFNYKPGDVLMRPRFNIPHQPRLDWQMWFAALSDFQNNRWLMRFSTKLLEGSKPILKLMKKNPFPDSPPRYLRAVLYEYHFTNLKTRRETHAWWSREEKGLYSPTMSLSVNKK